MEFLNDNENVEVRLSIVRTYLFGSDFPTTKLVATIGPQFGREPRVLRRLLLSVPLNGKPAVSPLDVGDIQRWENEGGSARRPFVGEVS